MEDVYTETNQILDAMSPKEKIETLGILYPITIVMDRYSGTYSGGDWLAFNLNADQIPEDVFGSDVPCAGLWDHNKIPVGIGPTPEEALEKLKLI